MKGIFMRKKDNRRLNLTHLIGMLLVLAIAILPIISASAISTTIYSLLTFIGVIKVTDASHLNPERALISDIYPQVKSLDGTWSETISPGDYVRITFQNDLTKKNDITIYPKIISGDPIIVVYEKGKSTKIAEFSNLISDKYNKVILSNLSGSQRSFDLHVLGGSIQIDQIIDPAPITNLTSPANGTNSSNLNQTFIANESSGVQLVNSSLYIWDSTGHSLYVSSGNMWIPNSGSNSVTKFFPNGTSITYNGTGLRPFGIAFDGTNMWVTNFDDASVTKVFPNGTMVNYTGTGLQPYGIAFDGTNMWVADDGGNAVTKISPSGTMTNYTDPTLSNPVGIAFDGTNMWVTNSVSFGTNSMTKVLPNVTMFSYSGAGFEPLGIAFDGTNMWVANGYPGVDNSVTKVLPNGTMFNYQGTDASPKGIAFDGTNMWTANSGTGNPGSVTKVLPNGTMFNYSGTGQGPQAIAFDGQSMWATGLTKVAKVLPNGTISAVYSPSLNAPFSIAFDGAIFNPLFNSITNTKNISGTSNSTSWSYNFTSFGTYYWNVYTCDATPSCAFNATNYTLILNQPSCWTTIAPRLTYYPTGCLGYLPTGTSSYFG